ncbi:MAG: hypothetical protein AAFX87_09620 [Bacteroidota bacterium]
MEKKRIIKSLEKLSPELKAMFRDEYQGGYTDDLVRLSTGKKEPIFVVPLDTDEATILVKIEIRKNSEGDYDLESAETEDNVDTGGFGETIGRIGDEIEVDENSEEEHDPYKDEGDDEDDGDNEDY